MDEQFGIILQLVTEPFKQKMQQIKASISKDTEEIKKAITPIALKYGLKAVYLFGSYARGTADENSDIALLLH